MCIQRTRHSFPAHFRPATTTIVVRGSRFSRERLVNGPFGIALVGCFNELNFGNAWGETGANREPVSSHLEPAPVARARDSRPICLSRQAAEYALQDGPLSGARHRLSGYFAGPAARCCNTAHPRFVVTCFRGAATKLRLCNMTARLAFQTVPSLAQCHPANVTEKQLLELIVQTPHRR
jgi:hypothetical protein